MAKKSFIFDIPVVHVLDGKEVTIEEVIRHIREKQAEKEREKRGKPA